MVEEGSWGSSKLEWSRQIQATDKQHGDNYICNPGGRVQKKSKCPAPPATPYGKKITIHDLGADSSEQYSYCLVWRVMGDSVGTVSVVFGTLCTLPFSSIAILLLIMYNWKTWRSQYPSTLGFRGGTRCPSVSYEPNSSSRWFFPSKEITINISNHGSSIIDHRTVNCSIWRRSPHDSRVLCSVYVVNSIPSLRRIIHRGHWCIPLQTKTKMLRRSSVRPRNPGWGEYRNDRRDRPWAPLLEFQITARAKKEAIF